MSKRVDQILIKPLVSEKSMKLQEEMRTVVFRVAPLAGKIEIRRAVETQFNVKVEDVNVLRIRGKGKRSWPKYVPGRRIHWKKAYVKLAEGHSIDFFKVV